MIHTLLPKYELLFDGYLGTCKTKHEDIKLQPDSRPYYTKFTPLQGKIIIRTALATRGTLKLNQSEWVDPTIISPKYIGTVIFLSDFRKLNQRIRRK